MPIDGFVFTKAELLEMLADKDENLGKQIARKNLPVLNPNIFYTILSEGIRHGFSIEHEAGRE